MLRLEEEAVAVRFLVAFGERPHRGFEANAAARDFA